MIESLTLVGRSDCDFRNEIQQFLLSGDAEEALDRLRTLLDDFRGPGRPLPARFLTVSPADIELAG